MEIKFVMDIKKCYPHRKEILEHNNELLKNKKIHKEKERNGALKRVCKNTKLDLNTALKKRRLERNPKKLDS